MRAPAVSNRRILLAAALGVLGGMGLRAVFNPLLGDAIPFVFAFPAVVIVSVIAGALAGILTALLCVAWLAAPWLLPQMQGPAQGLQVGLFLASSGLIAVFAQSRRVRRMRRWAEAAVFRADRSDAVRRLKLLTGMAMLLPAGFFALVAALTYQETLREASVRLDRSARVAEQHASRIMETNVVIARQILALLPEVGASAMRPDGRELHERLTTLVEGLGQIQSVWVWDERGRPVASNLRYPVPGDLDVSDRDYFRWARTAESGWFVSEVLTSRTTGEAFLDVTTRRTRADGSFAGAISVSLRPSYFADFYRHLAEADRGLTVTLLRADGTVLVRFPGTAAAGLHLGPSSAVRAAMSSGERSGTLSGTSTIDGRYRYASFQRVGSSALYVLASMPRERVLAGWFRQTAILAAVAFPLVLLVVFLSFVALRRARREFATLDRLRAESERRLQAEETLRHVQKLEALGQLTGGVAHDFNNLLMVVSTNMHLLAHRHPELKGSREIAAVVRATDSGARLTRHLLAFSRHQALHPRVISLQEVLPGMRHLLRTTTGGAIVLDIAVAPGTQRVEVDPAELELALINLAVNARDAMSDGGTLTISAHDAEPREGGADEVVIVVQDTGHGMTDAVRERACEPFYTTKPLGQGTGLGLSQVYGFCRESGGRLEIGSEAGRGTKVMMYLRAASGILQREPEAERRVQPDLGRCRLMLVEDNDDVAAATVAILESLGCDVRRAGSADEAMAVLEKEAGYDVVLSDVVMPGDMNGIDFARQVKARYPHLRFVLMTGYAAETPAAMAAGFEVLQKPCSAEVLERALREALERPTGAERTY